MAHIVRLREQLEAGRSDQRDIVADFKTLAKVESHCGTTSPRGGYLGSMQIMQDDKESRETLAKLQVVAKKTVGCYHEVGAL